jgi:hypothetical protein
MEALADCQGFEPFATQLEISEAVYEHLRTLKFESKTHDSSLTEDPFIQRLGKLMQFVSGNLAIDQSDPNNRKLVTICDIPAHQLLCAVDFKFCISSSLARSSSLGVQMTDISAQYALAFSDITYLAAFILKEKRDNDSVWASYIASLPRSYSSCPLQWSSEELSELQASYIVQDVRSRHEQLKEEFAFLSAHLPMFDVFTYDDWVWSVLTVVSRAFHLRVAGEAQLCMLPFADMFNHSADASAGYASVYESANCPFLLFSTQPVARGVEHTISYGPLGNADLLFSYGFCIPDNEDHFSTRVSVELVDGRHSFYLGYDYRQRSTRALFSFLRLLLAQPGDQLRAFDADEAAAQCRQARRQAQLSQLKHGEHSAAYSQQPVPVALRVLEREGSVDPARALVQPVAPARELQVLNPICCTKCFSTLS